MVDNPFAVKSLPLINQGKVRDIYRIDKDTLLIVASDRLSAFDVILPDPIPDKGKILTSISNFWFKKTNQIIQNHLIEDFDLSRYITEDEIKIIDGIDFKADKYFDISVNSWKLDNLVPSVLAAHKLCKQLNDMES